MMLEAPGILLTLKRSKLRRLISKVFAIAAFTSTFLLLSFSSASAEVFEIYTYGGGDFLYYVLNGVAMIFQTGIVKSLVGIGGVLLLITLVSRLLHRVHGTQDVYGGEGFLDVIKVSLFMMMAIQVFSVPKADVLIVDRTEPSQTQLVQNLPYVQAFAMHASSLIGDTVGEAMEDVFSLPDAIKFRNHGVALGTKYTSEFMGIYPPDTVYAGYFGNYRSHLIYSVLREFFMTCVFTDLSNPNLNNTTSDAFEALFSSNNILESPAIINISATDTKMITGIRTNEATMTCRNALPNIRAAWNDVYDKWLDDLVKTIEGRTGNSIGELLTPRDYMEQIFGYYVNGPLTSKQNIMNIAAINTMKDSMMVFVARTENSAALAEYLSKKKTTAGWLTAARLLNSVVVVLRQVFEALIYGLSIFLPLAIVLGGGKAFMTYVKLVFWLNLWVPFYVLLNLLADVKFLDAMQNLSNLADGSIGFNYRNFEEVQEQANIILGLIGATAWSVPALAWAVISGAGHGISSAVMSLSSKGSAMGSANQVGGDVAGLGNVSVGNRSYGNENIRTSDAISSPGTLTGSWVSSSSMQSSVQGVGLSEAIEYSKNNVMKGFGRGAGLDNMSTAFSTGKTEGSQSVGLAQAAESVAHDYGYSGVSAMTKAFGTMDGSRKASVLSNVGQQMGLDKEMASAWAGSTGGSRDAIGLMAFGDTLDQIGVSGLRTAGATDQQIKAAATLKGLQVMQDNGMSATDFGGSHGMLETAQAIGGIEGFSGAYNQARSNGYEGNPAQFFTGMSAINFGRKFTDAQAIKNAADLHFGGNEQAMLGGISKMHAHQGAMELQTAQNYGWTPERFGDYLGHMQALSGIGRAGGYMAVGDNGMINAESGRVENEAAKYEMMRMAAGISGFGDGDGSVSDKQLYSFLQAHHGQASAVLNDDQAQSIGHDKAGLYNFAFNPGTGQMAVTRGERGNSDSTFDISQNTLTDNPLNTDASTVWNKVQDMDKGFAKTLLSGSPAQQDTMARTVANSMAANLFMKRHGVDTDELGGSFGIGSSAGGFSGKDVFDSNGIKGIIGRAISISPKANLNFRSSNSYREEINKISKGIFDEIKGHQDMVNSGTWSKGQGTDSLSMNLKQTLREYESNENISDNTRRGKDLTYLKDNR